jgi:hypothetical protein
MIVANTGKVTELIEYLGSLLSAHEKAVLYMAKGRYKIKWMLTREPDDRLLLPFVKREVTGNHTIVLVSLTVASLK